MTAEVFNRLDERIQRWVFRQGWQGLRQIQAAAVEPVLAGDRDLILAAATAGGKTEAAFLPILTRVLAERRASIEVLYIGPLKALINDQFQRLELLCSELDVPVHRWHGDVAAARKRAVVSEPRGILLITPESLEAQFILQGPRIPSMFGSLSYVVVDELHAYPGTERGRQMQSLLHRLELALRRTIPRIGLSATLGDMTLAREFLRPHRPERVEVIVSTERPEQLKLLLKGYEEKAPAPTVSKASDGDGSVVEMVPESAEKIAAHLYENLRGGHHLVFANRKFSVEHYADRLRVLSEESRVPNEFLPHHGSLSKEIREDVERRLKSNAPTTVLCTSTLEMGIDIGAVGSVAQIGSPPSVASLRQRLGRSGRRGEPAVLRVYVIEPEITPMTPPQDALRSELFQAVAMVNLLLSGWCEPPTAEALHLSTLVQQLLSTAAQHGSVALAQAWQALCGHGPFRMVDQPLFEEITLALAEKDILTRLGDGTWTLGAKGERLVGHYTFFTAFQTPEEWTLVTEGRTLGSLPVTKPLVKGLLLVFAGRRWKVEDVDEERRQVRVRPSKGGRAPTFGGDGPLVHNRVREEMRRLYAAKDVPAFLDSTSQRFLAEGRDTFARLGLFEQHVIGHGDDVLVFPWVGDRVMGTLALMLQEKGLSCASDGIALTVAGADAEGVRSVLRTLADGTPADVHRLAARVENKIVEKHDPLLPQEALIADYAAKFLDAQGAHRALRGLF